MNIFNAMIISLLLVFSPSGAFAVGITSGDLEDCDVLIGKEKAKEIQAYMMRIKIAGEGGDAKLASQYAGILHNRFICHEEIILGDQPWTVTTEKKGVSASQTSFRPTAKNLQNHPDAFQALKQAVEAFSKIAEKDLSARTILGEYYADYSDVLKPSQDGYFYLASAYDSYCRPNFARPESKSRCTLLKHYKTAYLGLITVEERSQIDQRARLWSDQFMQSKITK